MSFAEVLQELSSLSTSERHLLVRKALEFDEPRFSQEDDKVISSRLDDHERDPSSAISLDDMKTLIRSRFGE